MGGPMKLKHRATIWDAPENLNWLIFFIVQYELIKVCQNYTRARSKLLNKKIIDYFDP